MSVESNEKALRAASRVAFLALVGCGGITKGPARSSDPSDIVFSGQDHEHPSDEPRHPHDSVARNSSGERTDAGGAAAFDAATGAGTPHEALSGKDRLAAQFPNGDPDWWNSEPGKRLTDPALAACCTVLAVAPGAGIHNTGCCHVNDWDLGPHCSPWGPPMPPAMRGVA